MNTQTNMADAHDRAVKLAGQLAECLNASDVSGTERLLALSVLTTLFPGKVLVEHPDGPYAEIRALQKAAWRLGTASLNEMAGDGSTGRGRGES